MIKRLSLLTRKPELTHNEFVRHWLEVHGPLALGVPGIRRYVQSHIQGETVRADIPAPEMEIDGIAELWYDSVEAMERSSATPEAQALYADGALIIGEIKSFVIEEKVIIE
ncbi:MAG: EthD family reductase [Alphaproteobacteria bacterium]|nr:EthD family reductase [Alphaproteobacteria bacterium]